MIRTSRLGVGLASLTAAALLLGALATPVSAGSRALVAQLRGANEVPGPGDADGWALAQLRRVSQAGDDQVCWFVVARKIDLTSLAAHIHPGAAGVANAPLVTFTGFTLTKNVPAWAMGLGIGWGRGCVTAPDATLDAIWASPATYYVNIHNTPFPNGAVRGQLH